jgi:hypothetical protein
MNELEGILNRVRAAAQKKVLFLPHALRQMLRPDRMISRLEIRQVIAQGRMGSDAIMSVINPWKDSRGFLIKRHFALELEKIEK